MVLITCYCKHVAIDSKAEVVKSGPKTTTQKQPARGGGGGGELTCASVGGRVH